MKTLFVWALVFFLAGMAAFGVYKSLDLFDRNSELGHSLALLNVRIDEMREAIADVQAQLAESGVVNEQLTNEVAYLKQNLAEKEQKIGQYHRYALLMKKKTDDLGAVNKVLAEETRNVRELLMRVRLENQEMHRKLSSVKQLRLAIQDLQRRGRVTPRRPAPSAEAGAASLPDAELVMGNRGYLVRDGVSTFYDKVDIQVRPAAGTAPSS